MIIATGLDTLATYIPHVGEAQTNRSTTDAVSIQCLAPCSSIGTHCAYVGVMNERVTVNQREDSMSDLIEIVEHEMVSVWLAVWMALDLCFNIYNL